VKVKSILVSQPEPQTENSPYFDLAEKYKLKIDFIPFIHVAGVDVAEVRKQKVNLANHTAVILTSRNAVDHYFRIAEEMRFTVPNDMKYFCTSEAIAYYLQKYVVYRKRKIYFGKSTFGDLAPLFKKHKEEKYLLPTSDSLKPAIPQVLEESKVNYTRAVLYNTVSSDLSNLADVKYDILVFFSPSGIKSLYENFPDFEQGQTLIAGFGTTTHKAIEEAGLTVNIKAPHPKYPSMTMALEDYIKESNKK
jgi:uroporphyrinogen-III synthase|tara:strand:- start:1098 stop:1844 length:747 start_codon:yes stop_codon:yes gene_type:complete